METEHADRSSRWLTANAALALCIAAAGCDAPRSLAAEDDREPPDIEQISQVAQSCGTCHRGGRALSTADIDVLTSQIAAVIAGQAPHPPVGLTAMDDATAKELARLLIAQQQNPP